MLQSSKRSLEERTDEITQWVLIGLSVLAALGAVVRVVGSRADMLDRLDETTLIYLAVAGALLLLRRVSTLSFGSYRVEFEQIRQAAEEAKTAARIAEDAAMYGIAHQPEAETLPQVEAREAIGRGADPDDPWKGRFGGKAEHSGRRLRAEVSAIPGREDRFVVHLQVEATSPGRNPLAGSVQFFLNQSFSNSAPVVPVGPNGKAELHLAAWRAFTVGALADDGETRLELDLSELEDAPPGFRGS